MLFSLLFVPGLALTASAAAAVAGKPAPSRCRTLYGLNKATACPTTWSTTYTACVTCSTSTVISTKTPAASTSTVITTAVSTATGATSTLTATSTAFSTTTTTVTASTTVTSVSTVVSTTTPIYTSSTTAGFIPVRSSLPGENTYSGSGGRSPFQKRDIEVEADFETPEAEEEEVELERRAAPSYYANKVECVLYSPSPVCSTRKETATSTVFAPIPTSTVTSATTITSTVFPSATTTVTTTSVVTTATTVTNTFTTSSTTTNFAAAPTQTYYQICAEENMADTFQGQIINSIYNNGRPYSDFYGSTAASAYECCVNAYLHSRDSEPVGVWNFNPPPNFRVNQFQNCNAYVQRAGGAQANGKGGAIYSRPGSQGVVGNMEYGEITQMYTS